ncbi:MAG: caspase family protein [Bacteroidales bacterium]|nr:caspase family protein [Bacteroidales bacterium]
MRKNTFTFIFMLLFFSSFSQNDQYLFQQEKIFGGAQNDVAYSLISCTDGNIVIAATTASKGQGGTDAWIIKTNADGNLIWDKNFGSAKNEHVYDIIETSDNGYIFVGQKYTSSTNRFDAWVVKIDKNGTQIWEKFYGQGKIETAMAITLAHDGGFVIAGKTASFGNGLYDAWILKIDNSGNLEWNKTLGAQNDELANDIIQTSDRNYAVVGYTKSAGNGAKDAWIAKIDLQGNLVWEKFFGKAEDDEAFSVIESTQNNFILSGYTKNVSTLKKDFWAASIDIYGNINWDRSYSSGNNSIAYSLVENSDNTFTYVGYSDIDNGKDIWLANIGKNGNKISEYYIDNSPWDIIRYISVIASNQFIVCGEKTGNTGSEVDVYFSKLTYSVAGQSSYYVSDVDENIPTNDPKNNHYALIIGNANYNNIPSLKYTVNDANTFKNYAITALGVPNDDLHLFYAENLSGNDFNTLISNFQMLIQDKTNSKFYVYYSGHGAQDNDSVPYLIPVDLSPNYISTQGIKLQTFINFLTPPPYNNDTVLFFFDACFSSPANSSLNKDVVGTRPKTTKTSSNIIIFSASDENERSQEDTVNYHGVFSYYLFKTIKENDGNITLYNLSNTVEQKVRDATLNARFNHQNPKTKPSNTIGDKWKNWTLY